MTDNLVIKSEKGNPTTTSLLVAEKFRKNHKDVLRAIENLVAQNYAANSFFYKSSHENRGKQYPMFIMNRDGFSLLVMGFTGKEALQFKLDFINAFNKMEDQIKSLSVLPDFNDPVAAARAWADEQEKKRIAESEIKVLAPKAELADRVIDTGNLVDVGQAAKLLKLSYGRNLFFKKLREDGVFFTNRNEPKHQFIKQGYFELRVGLITRNSHPDMAITKVLVTQKGLFWLSKKYKGSFKSGIPTLKVSQ